MKSVVNPDEGLGAGPTPSSAAVEARLTRSRARAALERFQRFREGGMVVAVLVTGLVFTALDPRFAAIGNLANIASQISFEGVLAVSMTFVLISGEIDLSIGSMVGLTGVIFGLLLQSHVPIWLAVVLTLLAGCLMGGLNGGLSVLLRVPTIIITLGMLSAYRGFGYFISNGYPVENYKKTSAFFLIGQDRLFGVVPYGAIVLIVFAVISAIVLRQTVIGHRIYAMGSNRRAAELAGIRTNRTRVGVLVFNGFAAAVAGLLAVSQTATADPNIGIGYELDVIAAVIIGGAKLTGGSGTVLGSILGMLLLGLIRNGLVLVGVSIYLLIVVSGLIVIVAVAIDRFFARRSQAGGGVDTS